MIKRRKVSRLADGVVIMTLSGLVVKAAGLFFKIPLTSLIGEEGMGYFNGAYTLFTWVYMLSAAGLPTAASMLIAALPKKRREDGAVRIFRLSLGLFTVLGIIGTAVLLLGAEPLSDIMRVENAAPAIIAMAPTLIFVTVSAALRGYFQGLGDLRPHSLSQVIEALGKVALGVALAHIAVSKGKSIPEAAAYAAFGITVGVAAGTVSLYVAYLLRKKSIIERDMTPRALAAKRLFSAALPITLSSSVMSLANLIDSFIMTRSLHAAGMSQAQTAAVWGNYSSLAMPMFNLPPVITMPIAYALLPSLASALASKDNDRACELTSDAVKQTAFLAVPCAVGMCAMSEPILALLFDDAIAERGAMMLTLLAPSSALLCMLGLFNTVLQASGHVRVPLISMLTGAAVKLAATWLLTPVIGKYATPVSTFACYLSACVIDAVFIAARTHLDPTMGLAAYVMPTVLSAIAVTAAVVAYPFVGTLVSVAIAAAVYFGLAAVIGRDKLRKTP